MGIVDREISCVVVTENAEHHFYRSNMTNMPKDAIEDKKIIEYTVKLKIRWDENGTSGSFDYTASPQIPIHHNMGFGSPRFTDACPTKKSVVNYVTHEITRMNSNWGGKWKIVKWKFDIIDKRPKVESVVLNKQVTDMTKAKQETLF